MAEKPVSPEIMDNFTVIDVLKEKVGTVDRVWVMATDDTRPEFYGVKTGFIAHKTHVIPADNVRIDFEDRAIWVPYRNEQVKDGPTFDSDSDLDEQAKAMVVRYYSMQDPNHVDPERDMMEHLL